MVTQHIHKTVKENPIPAICITIVLLLLLPRAVQILFCIAFITFGLTATFYVTRELDNLENLLPTLCRSKKVWQKQSGEFSLLKKKCPACSKDNCEQHRPEVNFQALQPWANLKVPQKVDNALEELLNLVIKEHVHTWYSHLSDEEAFIDEVRRSLRFVAAVALRRISKVDIPQFIQSKILRILIRHLHFYLEVKRKVPPGTDLEEAVLSHYGTHLHVAARNRKTELEYLSHVVKHLLPHVVHRDALGCKPFCILLREILSAAVLLPAMDVVAIPDIVNNILVLLFDDSPALTCDDLPSRQMNLLENFSKPRASPKPLIKQPLADMLCDPEAMFPFMQFMKSEAAVHVLNFYKTVEEFHKRLLNPELGESELQNLHEDLRQLYQMYLAAPLDMLQFDEDIIAPVRIVSEGPPEGVLKLQTSTPLFRAHDQVFELLENTYLPIYLHSDFYYKIFCGKRLQTSMSRNDSNSSLSRECSPARAGKKGSLTSKLGSKIKGVFKPLTIEGKIDPNEIDYTVAADEKMDDDVPLEESIPASCKPIQQKHWQEGPLRDLSAWRVTIPTIACLPDVENPKRTVLSFSIDVRRVDVIEEDFEASHWEVLRQYGEFYVLEQKLKEFHGEFEGIELPPKKVFGTKSQNYLESKRASFQTYLQRLLTLPNLKGSQLLYNFLTSDMELSTSFLPDINIGKLVKSGALKLVKERGQHLEPFLESFLRSTEAPKPVPSRWHDEDSDTQSISNKHISNSVYENNAGTALLFNDACSPLHSSLNTVDLVPVEGATDMLLYLLDSVYQCPAWLHNLLMCVRFVFRGTVDAFFDCFLAKKVNKVTQDFRVEKIIHQIQHVLFFDTDPPRTDEQKQARADTALRCLKNLFPKPLVMALGADSHDQGTQLLFEVLQKPRLNKHLSYVLVDEALRELFPELCLNKVTK